LFLSHEMNYLGYLRNFQNVYYFFKQKRYQNKRNQNVNHIKHVVVPNKILCYRLVVYIQFIASRNNDIKILKLFFFKNVKQLSTNLFL